MSRRTPTFAQLCVIVREQLEQLLADGLAEGPMYGELVERVKVRLVEVGFGYPASPEQLGAAIEHVERAIAKRTRSPA